MKVAIMIGMCYTFQFVVMPYHRIGKKYLYWTSLAGLLLLTFLLQISLIKLVIIDLPASATKTNFEFGTLALSNISSFILLFSTFLAFYYFVDIYDQQKEIKQLEHYKTQKIALESSFLKTQINPHFLFNTLNNIYALSLKKSEQTKVIIERLESLLHYMLYECKADLVPLANEFKFTESYISLEKLRHKEDRCSIDVRITGDPQHHMIAPLLLVNFLENAFKHGTKSSFGKSWIAMDIVIKANSMHFKLQNSKPFEAVGQAIIEYKGGIGLKNVKRRLEILYPRRHTLKLTNAKDRFEVDLFINF
ncbi:sensor histidine kinase [Pedobacter psychroterrae]|nr:histidine kinase [Pedobacter psychroterrae]